MTSFTCASDDIIKQRAAKEGHLLRTQPHQHTHTHTLQILTAATTGIHFITFSLEHDVFNLHRQVLNNYTSSPTGKIIFLLSGQIYDRNHVCTIKQTKNKKNHETTGQQFTVFQAYHHQHNWITLRFSSVCDSFSKASFGSSSWSSWLCWWHSRKLIYGNNVICEEQKVKPWTCRIMSLCRCLRCCWNMLHYYGCPIILLSFLNDL